MTLKDFKKNKALIFLLISLVVFAAFRIFIVIQDKQEADVALYNSGVLDPINRSYHYPSIDFSFTINEDTTVTVQEVDTYQFIGPYHLGWRSIVLDRVDDVTDIRVWDQTKGLPLVYSRTKLNKDDPSNWDKYTVYQENGAKNIEWYFGDIEGVHAWTISYRLHGAISFFEDHDELYWDLFTDLEVPVDRVVGQIILPRTVAPQEYLVGSFYRTNESEEMLKPNIDRSGFIFSTTNISPGEDVTITPGWPKGMVNQQSYYKDLLKTKFLYVFGGLMLFGTILWRIIFWYKKEYKPLKALGAIVPEYEPPQKLKPAMAELIMREKITSKVWPATIVDLAVRGYLKIIEEPKRSFLKNISFGNILPGNYRLWLILLLFLIVIIPNVMQSSSLLVGGEVFRWAVLSIVFTGIAYAVYKKYLEDSWRGIFYRPTYRVEYGTRSLDNELEDYERKFIVGLFKFGGGSYFSTSEAKKKSQTMKQALYYKMMAIEASLTKETTVDTKAYKVAIVDEKKIIFPILLILGFIVYKIGPFFVSSGGIFLIIASIVSVAIIFIGLYDPLLNERGLTLKKDWLGFKMYLETAEKYRMQNLTPDIFEKYLPYAIIFGVEKKWAKAFTGMKMSPPTWYGSPSGAMAAYSVSSNGFSPTGFTSAFSASFTSSFASSGGSGASGGGGGAGGGGGGGGGGAR